MLVKNDDETKMEEGEYFAIETFGSTGRGRVWEEVCDATLWYGCVFLMQRLGGLYALCKAYGCTTETSATFDDGQVTFNDHQQELWNVTILSKIS